MPVGPPSSCPDPEVIALAELNYDEIRRIHRLEKNTSKLVEVEPDFYNALAEFLDAEKESYLESLRDFSVAKSRDFTNLKKMVEEIFAMREKKILSRALIASRTKEASEEHMAQPERRLFNEIMKLLDAHEGLLNGFFAANASGNKRARKLERVSIKILADIPSFVGIDMKEYGPYSKGQKAELPYEIAKLLDGRKLAEIEE